MKRVLLASLLMAAASCGDKNKNPQPTTVQGENLEIRILKHEIDSSNEFSAVANALDPDNRYLIINVNGENRSEQAAIRISDFSEGKMIIKPVSKAKMMAISIISSGNASHYTLAFVKNDTIRRTELLTVDSGVVFTQTYTFLSNE